MLLRVPPSVIASMDTCSFLFHLAVKTNPSFFDAGDDDTALLTVEANRLRWDRVPAPRGDRVAFATGYIMGREKLERDSENRVGQNEDFDLGYECGAGVSEGKHRPPWDQRAPSVN